MNRRSLLDYLAENDDRNVAAHTSQTAESLERRLAELEARLSAAARPEEPAAPDQPFSSHIESILKRPLEQGPQKHIEPPEAKLQPAAGSPTPEHSADFAKFVEAVHLIGRAANRFLQEPPRQLPVREPAGPSQDTLMLTAALKETVAAFQAMTSNLAVAAGDIRRAAEMPKEAPQTAEPRARRLSAEDTELSQLQDDLDNLRERLDAVTRRRSRNGP
jgi:hypothetical protein